MRRITLWTLSTITILVLLLSYRTSTSSTPGSSVSAGARGGVVAANGPDPATGARTTPSGTGSPSVGRATPASPTSPATSTPTTKTYTGASVDTDYGPVQVQITVKDGKVTRARVTQVPWSGGRDQEINGYAVPILNKEAVQAQSATIDMVSGATFTSEGYLQSLQSAIDKAHL